MDIWLSIENFPNYEVNNHGQVRNKLTRKILKPCNTGNGYLRVDLNDRHVSIHRVVAKTFFDYDIMDLQVNHLDGNKKNNFIGNLEWTTSLENMRHARLMGLITNGGYPKKRVKIIETGDIFESINDCSRYIKGDRTHISECLRGLRRSHKGYHFEYYKGGL
jgi:hypothetical protein